MASITIRNLDDGVKQALRLQAATRARSMEEHIRRLLIEAAAGNAKLPPGQPQSVVAEIAAIMEAAGGGVVLEPYPDRPIDYDRLERRLGLTTSVE
jgi:antitoxin FitA